MPLALFSFVAAHLVILAGCASVGVPITTESASPLGSGYRVVVPASATETTGSEMVSRLARADVVFFGEEHDDPETHRAEAELLAAIGRTGRPVVLSLEMFERDVQAVLDEYLAGRLTERDFLAKSRPWARYSTDYRRLIEMAKERHWRVIAANVPRALAAAVSRTGLTALDTLTADERRGAAREVVCPINDDYHARFRESMRAHSPRSDSGSVGQRSDSLPTATAERFYLAQCLKDETMAESIVDARIAAPRDALVIHYTGAFHSDYSQGTVARVKRRQPAWTLTVVSAVPVADPATAPIVPQSGKADFVIFTRRVTRRP